MVSYRSLRDKIKTACLQNHPTTCIRPVLSQDFRARFLTIPDGAACYFCLGEEEDEEGKPLVRNCSCRGDSAGFAHLSCLTTYAEQKCKQADDQDMAAFAEPWEKCNNCKQPFQNQLSIDLVSACYLFAEATYGREGNNKYDKMKVMESLRLKIVALLMLNDYSNEVADEKRRIINHLLSMVDQTKKDYKMSITECSAESMRDLHIIAWG